MLRGENSGGRGAAACNPGPWRNHGAWDHSSTCCLQGYSSMSFVFTPPVASVPVQSSAELFPVHRIYCVGRNYVEHAIEMGHSGREAPSFFMKAADAVLPVAEGTLG